MGGEGERRWDPVYVESRKACHSSRGLSRVSEPLWGYFSAQHDRSFSLAIVILPSITTRFSRQPLLILHVFLFSFFLLVSPHLNQ